MVPGLDDPPRFDDQYYVSGGNSRETMSNDECGSAGGQPSDGTHQTEFRESIETACGFIEDDDRGIPEHGSRD